MIPIKYAGISLTFLYMALWMCPPLEAADTLDELKEKMVRLEEERADVNRRYDQQVEEIRQRILEIRGPAAGWWEETSKASGGFIDFNLYYDLEKFSVFTMNAGAQLPNDFSYYGFVNYDSAFRSGDVTDAENFYTEQNLTWSPAATGPVDWNVQWNLRSGQSNDRLRFAPQWHLDETPFLDRLFTALNLEYGINFHAVQIDDEDHGDYVWQMEHFYRLEVFPGWLDDRVSLTGFVDHTFGGPDNPAIVTENQLNVRIIDNWYAIVEHRRNEYRAENENSLGLGAKYVIVY